MTQIRLTIKNQLEDGFVEYLSHEDRNANYICIQKLGWYEDIDTDPKHLAKIKQAFGIIKDKNVVIYAIRISKDAEDYNRLTDEDAIKSLSQEEYDLLEEVLL